MNKTFIKLLDDTTEYNRHGHGLQQNYHIAVQCLTQCEPIIEHSKGNMYQKKLFIKALEMKIVKMSVELAKLERRSRMNIALRDVFLVFLLLLIGSVVVDDNIAYGSYRIDASARFSTCTNETSWLRGIPKILTSSYQ